MAKASKADIQQCADMFRIIEEFMDYGTFSTDEETIELSNDEFVERLRTLWGGRFRPAGVDCAWPRVVFGCDILIDNVCDPDAETLEWKPEYAAKLGV